MASLCISVSTTAAVSSVRPLNSTSNVSTSSSFSGVGSQISFRSFLSPLPCTHHFCSVNSRGRRSQVVCMAPEEEKMTRRSPLDFPIEWERPKPGRRPDIFPQFSPMKTPLPPPMPADPPEEDEEEEEKKEEEEDPEKEEQDNPDKQQ
ncbi:unnamed protein product [Amaranthus hypochondriacus]